MFRIVVDSCTWPELGALPRSFGIVLMPIPR
jgi:hypothetical protein